MKHTEDMKILKIPNGNPSERQISETARDLAMGATAIIPTDTIYGIVCSALDTKAIERICRLKGINPEKTNLSIICSDISQAAEYAKISNEAFNIIKEHTPGAYTFLLPATRKLPRAFKGRKTVGVRIPDSEIALSLVRELGHPLLTTSIEFSDEDYAREPSLISEAYHEKVDIMLEGPDGSDIPSTIIDLTITPYEIIREGAGRTDTL